jgi:hypothetical protein
MARARKPRPLPLERVEPGDTFALLLADGRWCACRVLGKTRGNPLQVLVMTSAWIGDAPPDDLSDPRLTTPLILTHHHWSGVADVDWVDDPVPAEAGPLGRLALTAEESALTSSSTFSAWASHSLQALLQWRWDHDREAVLAEEARQEQYLLAAREEAEFGYRPLPPSLDELRRQKVYPEKDPYPSPEEVRLSRRIIRDAIDKLIALGPDAEVAEKFDVFRRAVERFNETDFIDTAERDYLGEILGNIGDAAGLTDYDVIAWRDW